LGIAGMNPGRTSPEPIGPVQAGSFRQMFRQGTNRFLCEINGGGSEDRAFHRPFQMVSVLSTTPALGPSHRQIDTGRFSGGFFVRCTQSCSLLRILCFFSLGMFPWLGRWRLVACGVGPSKPSTPGCPPPICCRNRIGRRPQSPNPDASGTPRWILSGRKTKPQS